MLAGGNNLGFFVFFVDHWFGVDTTSVQFHDIFGHKTNDFIVTTNWKHNKTTTSRLCGESMVKLTR